MAQANGCNLPDDLYYWPEKHVWARPEPSGEVTVGITHVAQHLAGKVIVVTPKGSGKSIAQGKSAGTLESGKWVGTVPAPVSGEIVAVNDQVVATPDLVNQDPYGEGWIVRIAPSKWAEESGKLAVGPEGIAAYQAFLDEKGISCGG